MRNIELIMPQAKLKFLARDPTHCSFVEVHIFHLHGNANSLYMSSLELQISERFMFLMWTLHMKDPQKSWHSQVAS